MAIFCIACETVEIEEGPLCGLCAPVVAKTVRLLKRKERERVAREGKKPSYHEYERRVPLRPVTLPPLRFGEKDES